MIDAQGELVEIYALQNILCNWAFRVKKYQRMQKFPANFRVQKMRERLRFLMRRTCDKITGVIYHYRLFKELPDNSKS